MKKFYKIRYIAFVVYLALQFLLLIFISTISITEGIGGGSFIQTLVSFTPCLILGLLNVFLFTINAKKSSVALMVSSFAISFVSLCYYTLWFSLVVVRNISAIILRISDNATNQATISDYFLVVSHFGFMVALLLSSFVSAFIFFAYFKRNKTQVFIKS